jgi:hypothetical protein
MRRNLELPNRNHDESLPLDLVAYALHDVRPELVPAFVGREWMESTGGGIANRCMPLRIANQAGWFILNLDPIDVVWDGGSERESLHINYLAEPSSQRPSSHFGHGILTWPVPYLFRTTAGYNLEVRGPTNWCKDGISALDAIVETDWATATFTMNWKCTRPHQRIRFDKGEPICMLVPQKRNELETFRPQIRHISEAAETGRRYNHWKQSRRNFSSHIKKDTQSKDTWQKHYYVGKSSEEEPFIEHQTRLRLKAFQ